MNVKNKWRRSKDNSSNKRRNHPTMKILRMKKTKKINRVDQKMKSRSKKRRKRGEENQKRNKLKVKRTSIKTQSKSKTPMISNGNPKKIRKRERKRTSDIKCYNKEWKQEIEE